MTWPPWGSRWSTERKWDLSPLQWDGGHDGCWCWMVHGEAEGWVNSILLGHPCFLSQIEFICYKEGVTWTKRRLAKYREVLKLPLWGINEKTDYRHIHFLANVESQLSVEPTNVYGRNLCGCGILLVAPRSWSKGLSIDLLTRFLNAFFLLGIFWTNTTGSHQNFRWKWTRGKKHYFYVKTGLLYLFFLSTVWHFLLRSFLCVDWEMSMWMTGENTPSTKMATVSIIKSSSGFGR